MTLRLSRLLCVTAFLLACRPALAASEIERADLPPLQMVEKVLQESPSVLSAKGNIDVGRAEKDKLDHGPYEFVGGAWRQTRQVRSADDDHRKEWGVTLDRGIRLPGKGGLDEQIGTAGLDAAEFGYRDAFHEAARTLLAQWFEWIKARTDVEAWQTQTDLLTRQQKIVARREQLGDAAKLEASMAEAARAQADSSLREAQGRLQIAENTLRLTYPSLALPSDVTLADPEPIQGSLKEWRDRIVGEDHEIERMRSLSHQAALQANRASLNQIPDPTLGILYGSEQAGDEQYVGVRLSIPIPGTGVRRAESDAAHAEATVAAENEALTTRSVQNDIAAVYAKATAGYSSWQSARIANDSIAENAAKSAKAYELGEASLSDLLIAQRLRAETALTYNATRINAIEARYRLLLDSHQLWLPPGDDAATHDHSLTRAASDLAVGNPAPK